MNLSYAKYDPQTQYSDYQKFATEFNSEWNDWYDDENISIETQSESDIEFDSRIPVEFTTGNDVLDYFDESFKNGVKIIVQFHPDKCEIEINRPINKELLLFAINITPNK